MLAEPRVPIDSAPACIRLGRVDMMGARLAGGDPMRLSLVRPFVALALALAAAIPIVAHAQNAATQAIVLLRVVGYDRNLARRAAGETAVITLLYQPGNKDSERVRTELATELERLTPKATVGGKRVVVTQVAWGGAADLEGKLKDTSALYVCAGLEGDAAAILKATRSLGVLSLAGTDALVDAGATVGLLVRDASIQIVVNAASAAQEKADFNPALFRVATLKK
jgi:hypothetical protein